MKSSELLKEFFASGKELQFASNLTGDGTYKGGKLDIRGAISPLRQTMPFRNTAKLSTTSGSDVGFVAKVGNAISGTSNPWSQLVQPNAGSPNIDTVFWTQMIQSVSTYISVRETVLKDITDLEANGIVFDLARELHQLSAQSAVSNNDQGTSITATGVANPAASGAGYTITFTVAAGGAAFNVGDLVQVSGNTNNGINGIFTVQSSSATSVVVFYPQNPGNPTGGTTSLQDGTVVNTNGGTYGLRGLNFYTDGATAAYGSSGFALNNGIHSLATVNQGAAAISYNDLTNLLLALPAVYRENHQCKWHMHPNTIVQIMQLRDSQQLPQLLEVGDDDGGAGWYLFGYEIVPNSYIDQPGVAGRYVAYFGDWGQGYEVVDHDTSLTLTSFKQRQPGTIDIFGQIRLATSVINPFAIVRLKSV